MIEMLLTGIGMLAVTVLIQFVTYRIKKGMNFWVGPSVIVVICILGVLSEDPTYFAAILGYMAGDEIGERAGWHLPKG